MNQEQTLIGGDSLTDNFVIYQNKCIERYSGILPKNISKEIDASQSPDRVFQDIVDSLKSKLG